MVNDLTSGGEDPLNQTCEVCKTSQVFLLNNFTFRLQLSYGKHRLQCEPLESASGRVNILALLLHEIKDQAAVINSDYWLLTTVNFPPLTTPLSLHSFHRHSQADPPGLFKDQGQFQAAARFEVFLQTDQHNVQPAGCQADFSAGRDFNAIR